MDINGLRSIVTVLSFLLFIGIVWWAYSDRRKKTYAEAALLALDDDLPDIDPHASAPAPQVAALLQANQEKSS